VCWGPYGPYALCDLRRNTIESWRARPEELEPGCSNGCSLSIFEQCPQCGGPLTIIAAILHPIMIATILAHLDLPIHRLKISVEGCAEKVTD
jgi:hypothetical protein